MFNKYLIILFSIFTLMFLGCSSDSSGSKNHTPVITSSASVSVEEGQVDVLTITATDSDGDMITYSLTGGDAEIFNINAISGVITFKSIPYYETKNSYTFTADASDGATSDTLSVTIFNPDLHIRSAIYDNNRTTTTLDDTLYIYFSVEIDALSISDDISANYEINGTGSIGSASEGNYDDELFRHTIILDDGSSGSLEISTINDTYISLSSNTITDKNGIGPNEYNQVLIEKFNVLARLKTGQTTSYSSNDDGFYQKDISRSYTDNGQTLTDNGTGLIWQQEDDDTERNWDDAQSYCADITLDGNSDFRVPTIEELISLTDKQQVDPSINPIFSNTNNSNYWSSTTYSLNILKAWDVYFRSGANNVFNKTATSYVRCVR